MSDESKPIKPPGIHADLPAEFFKVLTELLGQKARESMRSVYSNSISFDTTELDVKMMFGQVLPSKGSVDWNTAVTIPWVQAKLLAYYLQSNIAVHEVANGTIKVPAALLPSSVAAPADYDTNQTSRAMYERVETIRRAFLKEQFDLIEQGEQNQPTKAARLRTVTATRLDDGKFILTYQSESKGAQFVPSTTVDSWEHAEKQLVQWGAPKQQIDSLRVQLKSNDTAVAHL